MSFNILSKNLQLQDTTILHLENPADRMPLYADAEETKPLTIELYGKSSKQHRTWLTAALRKNEASSKTKKAKTADELMAETVEYLVAMTKAVNNFDLDGEVLDNKESFKKLYSDPRLMWIGEQVSEKLGDAESFLQK